MNESETKQWSGVHRATEECRLLIEGATGEQFAKDVLLQLLEERDVLKEVVNLALKWKADFVNGLKMDTAEYHLSKALMKYEKDKQVLEG